ncbi:hypothetical protein [Streptomyces pseudogriseolus]
MPTTSYDRRYVNTELERAPMSKPYSDAANIPVNASQPVLT